MILEKIQTSGIFLLCSTKIFLLIFFANSLTKKNIYIKCDWSLRISGATFLLKQLCIFGGFKALPDNENCNWKKLTRHGLLFTFFCGRSKIIYISKIIFLNIPNSSLGSRKYSSSQPIPSTIDLSQKAPLRRSVSISTFFGWFNSPSLSPVMLRRKVLQFGLVNLMGNWRLK